MTTKRRVIIALAVLGLVAALPYTEAQQSIGIRIYICDYDMCSYTISTGAINVRAGAYGVWLPSFSISNSSDLWFDNNTSHYSFDFSGIFEANDINNDDMFNPEEDQLVGSIMPTWGIGEWVNEIPLPWEVTEYLYEFVELEYSNEAQIAHQDPNMIPTVSGWTSIPGHANYMDLALDVDAQFNISSLDQFDLRIKVTGWDWTFSDSLLVFIFIVYNYVYTVNPISGGHDEFLNWNVSHVGNRFDYGDAWMEYSSTASTTIGQIQVEGSSSATNPFYDHTPGNLTSELVFISFKNFGNEMLEFDATFGMNTTIPSGTIPTDILPSPSIPSSPTSPTPPPIDYTQLVLAAGAVSFAVIVIIIILEKRANGKRNSRSV
ncbi:MAG: hypothetical protein ACFFF9_11925 [Candidatus Thorarchaeota archaeon]